MKSRFRLFAVALSVWFAVPLLAQDAPSVGARPQDDQRLKEIHARMKADANAADAAPGAPDQFGINCCQITQIPASSFQTRTSTTAWTYDTAGYIYATTNPIGDQIAFWATVTLPSGVAIRYLDLWYNDTDAANDITGTIRVYTGSTAPSFFDVVSVSSSGSAGPDYNFSSLISHTVENSAQYTVVIVLPASPNSSLQFKAVDIWWNRQISPAPVVQTFNDVAPGDFGFQHIEALNASGITGGCGGGNFCPTATLTRAQMAVFLAKALGLYWPF